MTNSLLRVLLRIWRILPLWVHILGARAIRPRYRAGVVAAIFNEQGRILLFKHTYRKFEWGLPAGGLEYGEGPEAALQREFHEETGMQIRVLGILLAVSSREDHHLSLVYSCSITEGKFCPSPEISEMRFFDPEELPPMLFSEKETIKKLVIMNWESKHELA